MYRALILDYGGVMTNSLTASIGDFCRNEGVDPELFHSVLADAYSPDGARGMVADVERGTIHYREFERWLAEALSEGSRQPIRSAGLRKRLFAGMRIDRRMTSAVRQLRRSGCRVALLSNTWGPPSAYGRRYLNGLFDTVVRSDEVGFRKPERDAYLVTASRLDALPSECVFVDDLLANVDGARATGMEAFQHQDTQSTLKRLSRLLN